MTFRNTVRILISRFGYVWRVALYLIVALVIIGGTGYAVLFPVIARIIADGTFMGDYNVLMETMRTGGSLTDLFVGVQQLIIDAYNVISQSVGSIVSVAFFAFVVVGMLARFLLGLYELPLIEVMDSHLTSQAKIGFMGRLIATMKRSALLVFYKSIFLFVYDVVMVLAVFGTLNLLLVPSIAFLAPFFATIVLIGFLAFRSTLIAAWTPLIVVDKMGTLKALGGSIKAGFRNFGRLYGSYAVIWLFVVGINYLAAVYTFGAGLIITLPICLVFGKIYNLVFFYNKTNRRYYVDKEVFTPNA